MAMGDCLLVVGEAPMCRVHLHTDDPGAALTRAVEMGSIDRVAIANMHEQTRQREERLRAAPTLVALPGGRAGADRLTAENTAIVLDSTADLPHPEREHPNWRMVPLIVRFGEEQFEDWVGIEPAAVLPAAAKRRPASADGGAVAGRLPAHVRAAGRLRPHHRPAGLLARLGAACRRRGSPPTIPQAGGRVTVLDGHTVSVGTGMLADGVQRLLEAGTTVDEVTAWVEDARERLRLVIYVDTLEYLRRGGRISRTRELAGNMVGLRPLLTLRDGEIALYRRVVGGRRRALREFDRFLCANAPADADVRVALAHAADPEGVERLAGGRAAAAAAGPDRAGVRARRRRRHARRPGHARPAGAGGALIRGFAGSDAARRRLPAAALGPAPAHLARAGDDPADARDGACARCGRGRS